MSSTHGLEQRKAALSPEQCAALERRLAGLNRQSRGIARRANDAPAVCSFGQQRVWLLSELNPGSAITNRPTFFRLNGPLDVAVLNRCLNEVVRRHESLRTCFELWNEELIPRVIPELEIVLPTINLRDLDDETREFAVQRRAREFARESFDFVRGPLIKACVLELSEHEHLLMVNVDHIVFDGWSAGLLTGELAALYEAFSNGRSSPLPELPIQYSDFAAWQKDVLEPSIRQTQFAYWLRQLKGAPRQLNLPTDRKRSANSKNRGGRASLLLPKPLAAALHELARREGATLFMTLLAGFNLLLHRYTKQHDILVGSLVAGRSRLVTEKLIGMFVNTLALRSQLADKASFVDLLQQTKHTVLGAFDNQDLPFERLIQAMKLDRDRAPLVQVLFQLRNLPPAPRNAGPLAFEMCDFDVGVPQLELALEVTETPQGVDCLLRYDADLFEASTATRLLESYQALLEIVAAAPDRPVCTHPEISEPETQLAVADMKEWPLTAPQMGVWLDEQISSNPSRYNFAECWRIRGEIDPQLLQQALQHVVNETEALRLRVAVRKGIPVQQLSATISVELPVLDFREAARPQDEAWQWMDHDVAQPFAKNADSLFSFAALQTADSRWLIYAKYHHVIMDGFGAAIVRGRVADAYNALLAGEQPAPSAGLRWEEVVSQDVAYTESPEKQMSHEYWKTHCRGLGNSPTLSTRRESKPGGAVRNAFAIIPTTVAESLRRLTKEVVPNCPLNHVFYALLYAYLARITGAEDLTIALPRANRRSELARQTPGMFANVVLSRIQFPGNGTLRGLLELVSGVLRETAPHERYPLTDVQNFLPVEQRHSRLFTAAFNYLPISAHHRFGSADAIIDLVTPGPCSDVTALFCAGVANQSAVLRVLYPESLYTIDEVRLHRDRILHLLRAAPDLLDVPIGDWPLIPAAETERILVKWNDTGVDFPEAGCIHDRIERQAQRTPNAVAVVFEDKQLTYLELDRRANQLAHQLRQSGIGRGSLIGVCLPRGLEMTVGLLGIFKSGAAYLPLDAGYPPERLAFLLEEAQPAALLTQRELPPGLSQFDGPVVMLDDSWAGLDGTDDSRLPDDVARRDDLAYVMYTSGSTGQPKGVMITHGGLANHNLAVAAAYGLQPADRVMQSASLSFDIAVEEMFPSWIAGATVVVRPEQDRDVGGRFLKWIERQQISVLNLPTALWHAWVTELERSQNSLPDSLRLVVVGGEAASAKVYATWRRVAGAKVRWINSYGPTETTVVATLYEPPLDGGDEPIEDIPIGRPIANMRTYILDGLGAPVPIGVTGELYLAGAGLARGYLNRPELTAERFVVDPFGNEPGCRMYRTGDLVRWRPDGNIEFLGRADHQVKLRGFRIELGEIEAALNAHDDVAQCAVVLREDRPDDKRLVAYWVPRHGAKSAALRAYLASRVPEYMLPSAFISLDSLPLTSNGKIDRTALPAPERSVPLHQAEYVAPRNPVEQSLAAIWSEVLGIERVGIHDGFFELGGHSLLAIRMTAAIESELHRHVPLAVLFQSPTIASLAQYIGAQGSRESRLVAIPLQTQGSKPPLVFMPPMGGDGLHWKGIMAHWGTDRPVFAIGLSGRELPWPANATMADIARHCIGCIDEMISKSPIHLVGYSFGGKLAYEMARQLQSSGRLIGSVVIIDTPPGSILARPPRQPLRDTVQFFSNLPYWVLDDILRTKRSKLFSEFRRKARSIQQRVLSTVKRRAKNGTLESVIDIRGLPAAYVNRLRVGFAAAQSYVAEPYAGRVILVRARTRPLFRTYAEDLGWRRFVTSPLEIIVVPGNHLSILEQPNSRHLAAQLQAALDKEL